MARLDSLDTHEHNTEEHLHSVCRVYPTLAGGVVVTGGAAWTLGAFVEIIPASTITSRFDIHWLCIEGLDTNAVYEIVLYAGAGDVEVGRARVVKNANLDGTMNIPFLTPIIAADSRIRAKIADSAGGSVATISVFYHIY